MYNCFLCQQISYSNARPPTRPQIPSLSLSLLEHCAAWARCVPPFTTTVPYDPVSETNIRERVRNWIKEWLFRVATSDISIVVGFPFFPLLSSPLLYDWTCNGGHIYYRHWMLSWWQKSLSLNTFLSFFIQFFPFFCRWTERNLVFRV